jgi:uncharacterized protein
VNLKSPISFFDKGGNASSSPLHKGWRAVRGDFSSYERPQGMHFVTRIQKWLLLSPWLALALCLLLIASTAFALVPVPPLKARVTDLTGTLSAQQRARIEQELQAFEANKGIQIALLIVPTTQPEAIEQYSIRVVDKWKLGREGVDDGALLLIAKNDRTLRIEVGYGLEGALTDATSNRIIAEIITPYFRNGDYFGGIQAGVQAMMKVIRGEPLPAPAPKLAQDENSPGSVLPGLMFFAFFVGQMLRGMLGRVPAALGTAAVSTGIAWLLVGSLLGSLLVGVGLFAILLFSGVGGGGFGRGGYYSTGGFGGGFGGVGGGGGFGGGGASGRW